METADHQISSNTVIQDIVKSSAQQIAELRSDMQEYVTTTTRLLERIVSDMNDMERKIIMMESDISNLNRRGRNHD